MSIRGNSNPPSRTNSSTLIRVTAVVAVVAIIIFGLVFTAVQLFELPNRLIRTGDEVVQHRMTEIAEIVRAFRTKSVITELRSYATTAQSALNLEVAKLKTTEVFTRRDSMRFWPDVIVEISAPVEYSFYLSLSPADWDFIFEYSDHQDSLLQMPEITVIAPAIEWNPPAVNLAELDYRVVAGSILRNEERVMKKLQREIPSICQERARDKVDLIRAIARESTENFIQTWLVDVRFKDYQFKPRIKTVYFADERPQLDLRPPAE